MNPCQAIGPHHGDRCKGGRVQSPNAQFTQECAKCGGSGESQASAATPLTTVFSDQMAEFTGRVDAIKRTLPGGDRLPPIEPAKPIEPPVRRDGSPIIERPVEVPNTAVKGKRKHTRPLKPGPIVCRPVGEMLLADVPGFPAEVAQDLAAQNVRTLLDLEKHVESTSLYSPTWSALTALGVTGGPRLLAEKALTAHLTIGSTVKFPEGGERPSPTSAAVASPTPQPSPAVSVPTATPLSDAADFDEHAPPPRRRPPGMPIDMFTKLRAGSSVEAEFATWDREGRVPAGSILAEPIRERGTLLGWRLLGISVSEPPPVLPAIGEFIPREIVGRLKQWAIVSMKGDSKRNWYVLSAEERDA